jgi:hypothetical protein
MIRQLAKSLPGMPAPIGRSGDPCARLILTAFRSAFSPLGAGLAPHPSATKAILWAVFSWLNSFSPSKQLPDTIQYPWSWARLSSTNCI